MTLYFDGKCHICSREMLHYRKAMPPGAFRLVDITAPSFDAKHEGLDPDKVQKIMHIRLPNGEMLTGVRAFIAIWDALPGYRRWARLVQKPVFREGFAAFYWIFSRIIRPRLPKRKTCPL